LLYKTPACRQGPIPFPKRSVFNFSIFHQLVPSRLSQSIIRGSARNRGINRQSFDIPQKKNSICPRNIAGVPGNWQYCSILPVLPTACLFCTYFRVWRSSRFENYFRSSAVEKNLGNNALDDGKVNKVNEFEC